MQKYTKSAMVSDLAITTGLSQAQVSAVLGNAVVLIKEKTAGGMAVSIAGLGKFEQRTRKARLGRNPATGEPIEIPEKQVLTFKPAKTKT